VIDSLRSEARFPAIAPRRTDPEFAPFVSAVKAKASLIDVERWRGVAGR